jgi:spore maturation protein CgeB
MHPPLRIVFHGNAFYGSTSLQRANAFRELGHTVSFVPKEGGLQREPSLYRRICARLGYPCEVSDENSRLVEAVRAARPELVWIEKNLTIWPKTLRLIKKELPPGAQLVWFSADDMMNPRNQSAYWRRGLQLYDIHVTTKTPNLEELPRLGAKGIVFMPKSFDPLTHRPLDLSLEDRQKFASDVTFVGNYERERGESIGFLASVGMEVRVWGGGWARWASRYPSLRIEEQAAFGEEYAKAINAAKIVLCFLRKVNRDRQTARSIEIPACGAFMLAERTEEHQALFREDVEAAYFGSNEELVAKVRYYLANDAERGRIAKAGRQRCLDNGYSHASRLEAVLRACLSPALTARETGSFTQVWRAS